MRILITFFILLSVFSKLQAQENWTALELGNYFKLAFPSDYSENDSTEFDFFKATSGNDLFFAGVIKRDPYFHGNEEGLEDDYQEYLDGVLSKLPDAKVKSNEKFKVGQLIGKQLIINFDDASGSQFLLEQKVVIINDATFTFQFKTSLPISEKSDSLKERFLGSIETVEGVTSEVQIIPGSLWGYSPYDKGKLLSKSFLYFVLPGLLVLYQYIQWRKRKKS